MVYIQNQLTEAADSRFRFPNINPLQPPLGATARRPSAKLKLLKDTAKDGLLQRSRAAWPRRRAPDAVSANGSLNVLRYGRLLKARRLVGVRGAGMAYDGLYYVQERDQHASSAANSSRAFNLTRNGLVSITPEGGRP